MIERWLAGLLVVPFLLGAAAAPAQHGAEVVFRFQDDDIVEASALVVVDGLVVTSNDSGDTGRVFAVDPKTGDTVGVTQWADDPTDVESLAPGSDPHSVWVGDIGDNLASRSRIQIAEVPVGRGDQTVHPTIYDLAYPDGAHDAETLVRDPATDRLYIATKSALGGTLYAVPAHLAPDAVNRLTPVGPVLPVATDGAFLDARHLVIRNYWVASVYDFPSLQKVATFTLPSQPQGEGLGCEPDGTLLLDSEGRHSAVLRLPLPRDVQEILDPPVPLPSAPVSGTAHPASTSPGPDDGTAAPTASTHHSGLWLVAGLVAFLSIVVMALSLRRRRH